jgi:hypothetical protein
VNFFLKVDDVLPGVAYWESEFEYVECALFVGLPRREFFSFGGMFVVMV